MSQIKGRNLFLNQTNINQISTAVAQGYKNCTDNIHRLPLLPNICMTAADSLLANARFHLNQSCSFYF